jgi:predicted ATPase with chaperone activity
MISKKIIEYTPSLIDFSDVQGQEATIEFITVAAAGNDALPGQISLAHNGVLFLD